MGVASSAGAFCGERTIAAGDAAWSSLTCWKAPLSSIFSLLSYNYDYLCFFSWSELMIFSFCSCASPLIRRPPSYILTLMITRFVSDRLNKFDSALALPKRPAILAPLSFLAPNFSGTGLFAALGLPPVIVNGSSSSSIF